MFFSGYKVLNWNWNFIIIYYIFFSIYVYLLQEQELLFLSTSLIKYADYFFEKLLHTKMSRLYNVYSKT